MGRGRRRRRVLAVREMWWHLRTVGDLFQAVAGPSSVQPDRHLSRADPGRSCGVAGHRDHVRRRRADRVGDRGAELPRPPRRTAAHQARPALGSRRQAEVAQGRPGSPRPPRRRRAHPAALRLRTVCMVLDPVGDGMGGRGPQVGRRHPSAAMRVVRGAVGPPRWSQRAAVGHVLQRAATGRMERTDRP